MKLSINGIKEQEAWKKAGIALPGYDVETASEKAKDNPVWVHFGIGNIFRVFIGGIADGLLEEGVLDRGITCVETFDYDVVDKIYDPYDNLGLSVILHGDGTQCGQLKPRTLIFQYFWAYILHFFTKIS